MNLHQMVRGAIGTVNPDVPAVLRISSGTTDGPGATKVPAYQPPVNVRAQVQALTWKDLQQLDGINMNGTRRAIYLYGVVDGVVRVKKKGGDLITLSDGPNAGVWLVAQVLEQWPDWVKCAATLQNDTAGAC